MLIWRVPGKSVRHEVSTRILEGSVLFARLTERAWKLFLPRLLLHRPPRGGLVPKSRLHKSNSCADQAAVASRRRRRRDRGDDPQRRADRAEALVQMGEIVCRPPCS